MQASIFGACPKPGQIGRFTAGRASGVKMKKDEGGSPISPDGVQPSQIVSMSAYVIFPCTIKSRISFPSSTGSPR